MDSVEFLPTDSGFTMLVRSPGWYSQRGYLIFAAILLAIACSTTNSLFAGTFKINERPGTPADIVYFLPFWIGGLALVAVAIQGAYRKVVFTADAHDLVIATAGPLRRTTREYPRAALRAAIVDDSTTEVNGRRLKQLKLYFAGHNAPQTMLTGRDETDLIHIARHLTQALDLGKNSFSPTQYLEVRLAPLNSGIFKIFCGIGVAIGLLLMLLQSVIGPAAAGIGFFATAAALIVISSRLMRKAQCPQCGQEIRRDSLSPEGNYQYTCPKCRIVWQTPMRVGRRR